MFKVIVLFAIIAAVYGVPTPPPSTLPTTTTSESSPTTPVAHPAALLPALQTEVQSYIKKPVAAVIKEANGEEDPKNEKQDLEGAEFGWGIPRLSWGYPAYSTYSYYPTYEYPTYYYPSYQVYKYAW